MFGVIGNPVLTAVVYRLIALAFGAHGVSDFTCAPHGDTLFIHTRIKIVGLSAHCELVFFVTRAVCAVLLVCEQQGMCVHTPRVAAACRGATRPNAATHSFQSVKCVYSPKPVRMLPSEAGVLASALQAVVCAEPGAFLLNHRYSLGAAR